MWRLTFEWWHHSGKSEALSTPLELGATLQGASQSEPQAVYVGLGICDLGGDVEFEDIKCTFQNIRSAAGLWAGTDIAAARHAQRAERTLHSGQWIAALVRLHAQRPDGEEVGASLDALLQGARAQLELQVQARIQQAVRGRGGAAAASGGVTTARRTSSSPPATVAR